MGKTESMCECGGGRMGADLGEIGGRRQRDQNENGESRHLDSIVEVTWVENGDETSRVEGD